MMPVILRLIPEVHSSWPKNQTALRPSNGDGIHAWLQQRMLSQEEIGTSSRTIFGPPRQPPYPSCIERGKFELMPQAA